MSANLLLTFTILGIKLSIRQDKV